MKSSMVTDIQDYLNRGCGRCERFDTPTCKVFKWAEELRLMRQLCVESGLTEEVKWGSPCYTYKGANVILIGAFNDYCVLSILKGVLLADQKKLLVSPGPNSRSARQFKFTSLQAIIDIQDDIRAYLQEAIEVEKTGLQVELSEPDDSDYPEELRAKFEADPNFEAAFNALTPGRQRGYLIHFNGAKQSQTRSNRIEKFVDKIMAGKGWQDR